VVHLTDYARLLEDIPNKIRNAMGIICDVQLHDEEAKKYISIKVNPYSVAVSLRGRYYYRSGSTKVELTGVELNEFLLKKAGKTWDDVIEEGATVRDIDDASVAKFIEDSKEKGRMPDTNGLSTFQILEKLKLTEGEKLKRAAIIMFGKDPMRFYPNIQVKIGRFGTDAADLKFHEVLEGNIVQLLHEVQVQLNYKFLTRPISFEGFQRVEKDQYPIQALREMLLNALVHRTYIGATIQMRVFDDKLSIWNEGLLPFGLSLEDLKSDHNSRPRNPLIANACFFAGYIDTWGRGTLKIINACKEAGLPEPETKEMNGGVEVTIFLSDVPESGLVDDEIITPKGGQAGGQVGGQAGGQVGDLTERQQEVFNIILSNQKISRKQLSEKLGINESAVQKHIDALKKKNIIERDSATTGQWIIKVNK
jgi:ATP-dependent DNA helicase RecG